MWSEEITYRTAILSHDVHKHRIPTDLECLEFRLKVISGEHVTVTAQ